MFRPGLRVAAVVSAVLLLSGCGQAPSTGSQTDPAGGGTPATSTAAPDPAAGLEGDRPPHYDENHAYRERVPVAASAAGDLEAARDDVEARLAAAPHPPTVESVTAVVEAAGDPDPWVTGSGDGGVAFESQVGQSGCLVGRVTADGAVHVETGGFIADGGCHALTGH